MSGERAKEVQDWMIEVAKWTVAFLREIDWSMSSNEWKYQQIAQLVAEHCPEAASHSEGPPPTPYTLRIKDDTWIAHALAFDLIGTGATEQEAIEQLRVCLGAQVAWAEKEGTPLGNCYFAAPPVYWEPPIRFMPMPTKED